MEAIGRLAAGVAHEFNNILLAIRSSNWLLARSENDGDHAHNIAQIDQSVQPAACLTQQLLAFGQPQLQRVEVVDLAAAVVDMNGLLRALIPEDVELELRTRRSRAPVGADRSQIEQ